MVDNSIPKKNIDHLVMISNSQDIFIDKLNKLDDRRAYSIGEIKELLTKSIHEGYKQIVNIESKNDNKNKLKKKKRGRPPKVNISEES